MKNFTQKDVSYPWGQVAANNSSPLAGCGKIYVETSELLCSPLWWQKKGLSQTRSGYGRNLTNSCKISFEGKLYRLHTTIYSNSGSTWFTVKGKKIFVD
jgi:hypothetical protein